MHQEFINGAGRRKGMSKKPEPTTVISSEQGWTLIWDELKRVNVAPDRGGPFEGGILWGQILICATDQGYLTEMLKRIDRPVTKRALPKELPEWKHVEMASRFWGIRHYG